MSKECPVTSCPLRNKDGLIYVGHSGRKGATYMLIGERGGNEEIKIQKPFVGRAGQLLDKILSRVGINKEDCFITNALGCGNKSGVSPTTTELNHCRSYLEAQIKTIKPKIIILLGRFAMHSIYNTTQGIEKLHGYVEWNDTYNCWVVATYHPAWALKDDKGWLEWEIVNDIQRAIEVLKGNRRIETPEINILSDKKSMIDYIRSIHNESYIAYDLETNTLKVHTHPDPKIACISIATTQDKGYVLWVKDLTSEDKDAVIVELQRLMESPKMKIGANIGYDNSFLERVWNINVQPPYFDVITAHRIVCTASGEHGLKAIAKQCTNFGKYNKNIEDSENEIYDLPKEVVAPYAGYDAVATLASYQSLSKTMEEDKPLILFSRTLNLNPVYKLSMGIEEVVSDIEKNGVSIDIDTLRHVKLLYEERLEMLELKFLTFDEIRKLEILLEITKITKQQDGYNKTLREALTDKRKDILSTKIKECMAKCKDLNIIFTKDSDYRLKYFQSLPIPFQYVNISSNPQIAKLLFEICKIKPLKRSKKTGKPSVDVEVLEGINHPVAEVVRQYRHIRKMLTTYLSNMEQERDPNSGVLHLSYIVNGAISGRLSSPFHTYPSQGEDAIIKAPFNSGFLNGLIVEADFGQMELRCAASLSGDEQMIQAMIERKDLHRITAGKIFGVSPEDVTPEQRQIGKTCNFAMIYAVTPRGLVNQKIASTEEEAKHFLDSFFSLYPGIKDFMNKTATLVTYTGFTYSPLGRYRDLSILLEIDKYKAIRQGINFPVQSVASDYAQIATRKLYDWIKENKLSSRIIGTKHDSTSIDCYSTEVIEVILKFKEIAESGSFAPYFPDFNLSVPLEVDFKVGKSLFLTGEDELPKEFFKNPKELLERHLEGCQIRWNKLFKGG